MAGPAMYCATFSGGAGGCVEGCTLAGASEAGVMVHGAGWAGAGGRDPSRPRVANNAFRGCRWGVYVAGDVGEGWEVGPGNVFEGMEVAAVEDRRARGGRRPASIK